MAVTAMTSSNIEEWRDIPGYEGRYQASNLGRIRSLPRVIDRRSNTPYRLPGRILRPRLSHKGYLLVGLSTESKVKNLSVHRLVAQAFLPNTEGFPEVNHINGNKKDNRAANLEWVTTKENVAHSIAVLGNRRDVPRYAVICLDTGRVYASAKDAAKDVDGLPRAIRNVCHGKKKRHRGLRWAYKEETHEDLNT